MNERRRRPARRRTRPSAGPTVTTEDPIGLPTAGPDARRFIGFTLPETRGMRRSGPAARRATRHARFRSPPPGFPPARQAPFEQRRRFAGVRPRRLRAGREPASARPANRRRPPSGAPLAVGRCRRGLGAPAGRHDRPSRSSTIAAARPALRSAGSLATSITPSRPPRNSLTVAPAAQSTVPVEKPKPCREVLSGSPVESPYAPPPPPPPHRGRERCRESRGEPGNPAADRGRTAAAQASAPVNR